MARTIEIAVGAGEIIQAFNINTTTTANMRVTAASADDPATPVAVTISSDMTIFQSDGSTGNVPVTGELVSVNGDTNVAQVRIAGICKFKYTGTAPTSATHGRKIQMSESAIGKVRMAATNVAAERARGFIMDVNTSATTVYVLL
jgi:hypothetical protein